MNQTAPQSDPADVDAELMALCYRCQRLIAENLALIRQARAVARNCYHRRRGLRVGRIAPGGPPPEAGPG